jgi:hypothetical protein
MRLLIPYRRSLIIVERIPDKADNNPELYPEPPRYYMVADNRIPEVKARLAFNRIILVVYLRMIIIIETPRITNITATITLRSSNTIRSNTRLELPPETVSIPVRIKDTRITIEYYSIESKD